MTAGGAGQGKVGRLVDDEVARFFVEPNTTWSACLDAEGWPHVVPCEQEGDEDGWWVVSRERAAWVSYLERDPWCVITAGEADGQRKVLA